jgi:hypothetical protein
MREVRDIGRQASGRQHKAADLPCAPEQRQVWRTLLAGRSSYAGRARLGTRDEVGSLGTHVSVMNVRRPSRSQCRLWRCDDSDGGHSGSRISVVLRAGRTAQYF